MAAPGWQAREALATRLKALREATGLTQAAFAQRLGTRWDQTKVSDLEAAAKTARKPRDRIPTPDDMQALAAVTGADYGELLELRNRAQTERDLARDFAAQFSQAGGAAEHQGDIATAEAASKRLAFYYPLILPGVLQTAEYAQEMLSLDGGPASYGATEDDIHLMIAARSRRAAILREPGRQVTVLIGETALRSQVASPETMADQCEHIARLATSPATTAVIGVVPFTARLPFAAVNGWEILDDLVLLETESDDLLVADSEQVARYWRYTRALLGVALIGSEAAALCHQITTEAGTA